MKWDGHTHSHFCKHGSDADLTLYLNRAVELGFNRYTVSEHPPLPDGWISDSQLFDELAMKDEELPLYFDCVADNKRRYEGRLDVRVGLELDYLHEREDFTNLLIDRWSHKLEDVLISVHYLPGIGGMRCIDYKPDDFRDGLLDYYGSMEAVVEEYYNHVELAVELASQWTLNKRIGHINLIEKFRLALPEMDKEQMNKRLLRMIPKLKACGVGIDVNTAGFRKETCGKAYAPEWFIKECMASGIECVFGSDAHHPQDVGKGWEWYARSVE